jgi:hypothetical protein
MITPVFKFDNNKIHLAMAYVHRLSLPFVSSTDVNGIRNLCSLFDEKTENFTLSGNDRWFRPNLFIL